MPSSAEKIKTAKRERPSGANAPWKLRRAGGVQALQAPALARLEWLVHGFSTRQGGASRIESARPTTKGTLNMGFTDWDSRDNVTQNREKFARAIGAERMPMRTLRQIHSDIVRRADAAQNAAQDIPNGDALVAREAGILLAVQTADCVPILLADTKRRAIAAIHSGWRGTLARIAAKTIGRMRMEFGTKPADVLAALGPGVGRCCFEVGAEVAKEFAAQFPEARQWFDGPFDALASGENDPNWLPWLTMMPPGHPPPAPRAHLDLIAANRAILEAAGVPAANISASGYCTACRTDLFFSYRREGTTGRMMAAIAMTQRARRSPQESILDGAIRLI
ncbi:MAG TPA: peptidoglycan editing factor PgeF [Candidatus Acidoferrales bacterium]|nr:peptidoglycan editing factor PgeF [Candidatus Acidoferrales bacterium]